MNRMLACFVAFRYLFSKKSFNSINLISIVSVASIAVATMAMIIILSVFNGFQQLAESNNKFLGSPLKVIPSAGRYIRSDSLRDVLKIYPEIVDVVEILESKIYVNTPDRQRAAELIGISENFRRYPAFENSIIDGSDFYGDTLGATWCVMSVGMAVDLAVRPGTGVPVTFSMPKKEGRINPGSLVPFYRSDSAYIAGVYRTDDAQIDADKIIADIDFVRRLSGAGDSVATSLNIFLSPSATPSKLKDKLKDLGIETQTIQEQNADAFHMIAIEKWLSFTLLAFIMIVASFNLISTITILISEKEPNMNILRAMGGSYKMIRLIFMGEGLMISMAGGIIGVFVGVLLSLGQQYFGWIKLSADIDPSMLTITSYPVVVKFTDILVVFALLIIISFITTFIAVFSRRINKESLSLI